MVNRIKEIRLKKGLSLEQVAERANTNASQIQKLEAGTRRLSTIWMDRLAPILGVNSVDLISDASQKQLEVVGFVTGSKVSYFNEGPNMLQKIEGVPWITEECDAFVDKTPHPMREGWYFLVSKQNIAGTLPPANTTCLLEIDGISFLGKVVNDNQGDTFDLVDLDTNIYRNKKIKRCSKVLGTKQS